MYLEKLSLSNFRNYPSLDLALEPGPVVIYGHNAQGKSNLLEAVYFLATTKSPRASSDRELVHWDALDDPLAVARIVGEVRRSVDSVRIEIAVGLESTPPADNLSDRAPYFRKQSKVNGIPRRASDLLGQLNVVMFTPQDVDLVSGPPSRRRRYMDITNSQVDRAYLRTLQHYGRVVFQRNHLLRLIREGHGQMAELSFWDQQLVEDGCFIFGQRRSMVEELARLAKVIYSELSGGSETLELLYLPSPSGLLEEATGGAGHDRVAEVFREELDRSRPRELAQAVSVVGPHRDDLQFLIDGKDMGSYGSRGQQRTIICALKLAEANFLVGRTGEDPVLLLDDILSELDASRRLKLLDTALSNQQTFLTATDLDRVDERFLSRARILMASRGQLNPVYSPQ